MPDAWTVKDRAGSLLAHYTRNERLDVERLVLPIHYDATRIRFEPAYRREFQRLLARTLAREGWAVVPVTMVEGHAAAAPARMRPGAGAFDATAADLPRASEAHM